MSIPFIVPKKSGRMHREKLQMKDCAFPGCKKVFKGTGKSRYCLEHRHRKYRKIIDAGKIAAKIAEEESRTANQTLKHSFNEATLLTMNCKLDGCHNEFEIKVFPNIYVYPKFCPEHRNEHKRTMFMQRK
jgi:hypothetical protein